MCWGMCFFYIDSISHLMPLLQGKEVGKTDFKTRLSCIQKEIYEPRSNKIQKGLLDRMKEPFGIRPKPFWDLSQESRIKDTKKVLIYLSQLVHHSNQCMVYNSLFWGDNCSTARLHVSTTFVPSPNKACQDRRG